MVCVVGVTGARVYLHCDPRGRQPLRHRPAIIASRRLAAPPGGPYGERVDTARRPRFPRLSRRSSAAALSILLLISCLIGACNLYTAFDLERGPNDYNIADWELRHIPEKWLFLLGQAFRGEPSLEQQDQTLRRFFGLTREIEDLARRISDAQQRGLTPSEADRDQLASLLAERDAIENEAEATIESRLTRVAADGGLTRSLFRHRLAAHRHRVHPVAVHAASRHRATASCCSTRPCCART